MSGSFISTGMLTNNGEAKLKIERIMNLRIENLSIQIIPIKFNSGLTFLRGVGRAFQQLIHPAIFSPTLSHVAIQLNLGNKYIAIMEYGQYYSDKSEIRNTNIFSSFSESSDSSNESRYETKDLLYWYINKDGARITLIDKIAGIEINDLNNIPKKEISLLGLSIIAANQYHMSIEEFDKKKENLSSISEFDTIDCNVNNKISLRQLCYFFKGKKWESTNYNVFNHNCQTFVAEIIRIVKAVRINDYDKVRWVEKRKLPNCIISALWDNEDLSAINTIGRIPIIGYLFDSIASKVIQK